MAMAGVSTLQTDQSRCLLCSTTCAPGCSTVLPRRQLLRPRACISEHDAHCCVLQRLKGGEWFTTRVSACSLFAATYPPVSGDTAIAQELCSMFRDLCRDDTPMVRRAAASNVGPLAAAVDTRTAQQVRRTHSWMPPVAVPGCIFSWWQVLILQPRAQNRRDLSRSTLCRCHPVEFRVHDSAASPRQRASGLASPQSMSALLPSGGRGCSGSPCAQVNLSAFRQGMSGCAAV